MSGFFGLINNILVDIVHNWIEFQDLIKVDTACCNKKARVRFLDILSRNSLDCSLECDFSKTVKWGQIRQVLVIFHNFKISSSSMIHKKLLQQAAFIVSLTIKMKKRDCDDTNLLSNISLWFQNLKSLKFVDFVPNYDNILKIDHNILNQLRTLHLQGVYKYSFILSFSGHWGENHNSYTQFLLSLPRYCPNLIDVSLLVHYQQTEIYNILNFLARLKHLKRLEICVERQFSDYDLQLVMNSCPSTIEKLHFWIRDSWYTSLKPQHIVHAIQQCPQLREFTVCFQIMNIRKMSRNGTPIPSRPITFKTDNDSIIFSWKRSPCTDTDKSSIDITLNAVSMGLQHIQDILSVFPVIQQLTLTYLRYDFYLFLLNYRYLDKIEVSELVLYKCCYFNMGHYKKLRVKTHCFDYWGRRMHNGKFDFHLPYCDSSRVEFLKTLNTSSGLKTPHDVLIQHPYLKHVHFVDCFDIDRGELMKRLENSDRTVTITFSTSSDKKTVFSRMFSWFSGV